MPVSKDEFRQAVAGFASGVTVITTACEGHLHGMTATAFSSLSLEPPLVLVCIDSRTMTKDMIESSGIFAVNVLVSEREDLSRAFATRGSEESHGLIGVEHRIGSLGAPLLNDVVVALECQKVMQYEGGDHTIFVGEVEGVHVQGDREPLVYYRGGYRGLAEAKNAVLTGLSPRKKGNTGDTPLSNAI